MIAGIFHEGSGLGNQLFRYITVRTLAEDKGYQWEMLNQDYFKGNTFMQPKMGTQVTYGIRKHLAREFTEKKIVEKIVENSVDIRSYDPEINFVEDNTVIDGEFQDDKYWRHKLPEIDKWLAVEPQPTHDFQCMIGFRGGEYYVDPNLGLPKSYFDAGIEKMREINPLMMFIVHTDDPSLAEQYVPGFYICENQKLSHSKHTHMDINWRSMRYSKYAVIANSSFYILPRLLKHYEDPTAITIAPRGWARHNLGNGTWALPSNYYKEFTYI